MREYASFPVTCKVMFFDRKGERTLLVKKMGGRYALVGGHLELNETPEEAARREMREEIGLEYAGELRVHGAGIRVGDGAVTIYYGGVIEPEELRFGEMQSEEEILGVEWVRLELIENGELDEMMNEGYIEEVVTAGRRARGEIED